MLVIILESRHLHTPDETKDVHDHHPVLKEKLSPGDKCWQTEPFQIVKPCDLCTGKSKEWTKLWAVHLNTQKIQQTFIVFLNYIAFFSFLKNHYIVFNLQLGVYLKSISIDPFPLGVLKALYLER